MQKKILALVLALLAPSVAFATTTQAQKQERITHALTQYANIPSSQASFVQPLLTGVYFYDTAAELLAATPAEGHVGYALDTNVFYARAGTSWIALASTSGMVGSNGGTFGNETNNEWKLAENSEDIKLTFGTNSLTLSSGTGLNSIAFGALAPTFSTILTMTNGGTISNETDNAFIWAENSEDLKLAFTSNLGTYTSSTGVSSLVFTGIGLSTSTSVQSASLVTTTLEADLTAGACTAGTWKVDNVSTRELCRCNDAGSAYDCISVTTANGPTN